MKLNKTNSTIYAKFLFAFSCFVLFSTQVFGYVPQYLDETKNVKLHWKTNNITISFSTSLYRQNSNVKSDSDVQGALNSSLKSWENAANIKFFPDLSDKQTVSPSGVIGDGISLITNAPTSENLLLFAGDSKEIPARTRVFFNRKGFITEADIVLNPYLQFSTDGTFGTFDLESVITHELGHLLGLEHSPINGSTMYSHIGKNGVYSMPNFTARTLSDDDISGIRAIYGTDDVRCCGSINGKLFLKTGKSASNFQVWAEESQTGKISAGVLTNSDGSFQLEGLNIGKYILYTQDKNKKSYFSAEIIDEINVEKGKSAKIEKRLLNRTKTFNLSYVGFNGELAKQVVSVNQGKVFTIYIGGENTNFDELEITFNSPFLKILPNSFTKHDFDNGLNAISFDVLVKPNAENGDYSLQIYRKNDEKALLVGSLTIDKFTNPFENHFLINEE